MNGARSQTHPPRPRRRWLRRGLVVGGVVLVLGLGAVLADGWRAFGRRAEGARRARFAESPQWRGDHFVNPQPLQNFFWRAVQGFFDASPHTSPAEPVPTERGDIARFAKPPATGLRVTWFGHSSVLVEIDGARVLTDPIWSGRASPFTWIGPRRWYQPPVALSELPPVDVVVISHDHYDHLDKATVTALNERSRAVFVVPLGMGAHLTYWGIPEARIVELDWWQRTRVGGLEVVSVPSRHASGRFLFDKDAKLWGGWALIGPRHRVYYSGDTGLFPALRDVGKRLGPFDLTMIEVGQYGSAWPDWHLGPEQAVVAHQMVGGRVLLPVHWGTFTLAYHAWTEPIERALAAGARGGASVVVPRPGQSVEPEAPPPLQRWWPQVQGKTADEDPINSTMME